MTLELLPLVKEDVDEVVQLVVASYANNSFRRISCPNGTAQSSLEIMKERGLKAVDDPDQYALKVVDTDTGEIAACAFWAYTQSMTDEDWDREREEALKSLKSSPEARQDIVSECIYKEQDSKRRIMGHTRWWELSSLNTLPKYQRRGIGSMLMEWGTDKLEEMQVPSFIIATDQGYGLYIRHGYKEIERWEIDMGRWPQWGGNGMYKNVFLTRYPAKPAEPETGESGLEHLPRIC